MRREKGKRTLDRGDDDAVLAQPLADLTVVDQEVGNHGERPHAAMRERRPVGLQHLARN